MTSDEKLFERLDKTTTSRVRIGNGEYLPTKGKWTVAIEIILAQNLFMKFYLILNLKKIY